jgi:ribosomal protein S18 acetylase RimI-like enzyme
LNFKLRSARDEDAERILEISSRIWEGEDYIPYVLEEWLRDKNSELCVAELEGNVISFARYLRLVPGYIWLEGLRTHPDFQGRGAARAITHYLIEKAVSEGALRVGLSVYSGNTASLRLAESMGFKRRASFVYLEGKFEDLPELEISQEVPLSRPLKASDLEACDFLFSSKFLLAAKGYLPLGWRFYPFFMNPETALSRMKLALQIRDEGGISALLLSSEYSQPYGGFSLDFLEGSEREMLSLLAQAKALAKGRKTVEAFVPKSETGEAPLLSLLKQLPLKSWSNFQEDIFVYELILE